MIVTWIKQHPITLLETIVIVNDFNNTVLSLQRSCNFYLVHIPQFNISFDVIVHLF